MPNNAKPLRVSLVIPHRNEAELIEPLISRLARVLTHDRQWLSVYLVGTSDDPPAYKRYVAELARRAGSERIQLLLSPRGVGRARDTGCRKAIDDANSGNLKSTWLLNTEADCLITSSFVDDWLARLSSCSTSVAAGKIELDIGGDIDEGAITGGLNQQEIARINSEMVSRQEIFEQFAGVINTVGPNMAIRADTYCAVGGFENAYVRRGATVTHGAGEDWKFGAKCRRLGIPIAAVGPLVRTSSRRLGADPAGFLTGDAYRGEFVAVSDLKKVVPTVDTELIRKRQRLYQRLHYLIKPLVIDVAFRKWLGSTLTFGHEMETWVQGASFVGDRDLAVALGVRWGTRLEIEAWRRSAVSTYDDYLSRSKCVPSEVEPRAREYRDGCEDGATRGGHDEHS